MSPPVGAAVVVAVDSPGAPLGNSALPLFVAAMSVNCEDEAVSSDGSATNAAAASVAATVPVATTPPSAAVAVGDGGGGAASAVDVLPLQPPRKSAIAGHLGSSWFDFLNRNTMTFEIFSTAVLSTLVEVHGPSHSVELPVPSSVDKRTSDTRT